MTKVRYVDFGIRFDISILYSLCDYSEKIEETEAICTLGTIALVGICGAYFLLYVTAYIPHEARAETLSDQFSSTRLQHWQTVWHEKMLAWKTNTGKRDGHGTHCLKDC